MRTKLLLAVLGGLVLCGSVLADSIWDRRDPRTAYLFYDLRARQVGDLLTIVVNEATAFEGQEKTEFNKETQTSGGINVSADAAAGKLMTRTYTGDASGKVTSQRKFDGKANSTIDRRFADRMTVTVVDVLPNSVLVIEGTRTRVVNGEVRTLKVCGLVRPADIGPSNTVQSQFIGNFQVSYVGRGPETSYTNHGWMGRVMNHLWPF